MIYLPLLIQCILVYVRFCNMLLLASNFQNCRYHFYFILFFFEVSNSVVLTLPFKIKFSYLAGIKSIIFLMFSKCVVMEMFYGLFEKESIHFFFQRFILQKSLIHLKSLLLIIFWFLFVKTSLHSKTFFYSTVFQIKTRKHRN